MLRSVVFLAQYHSKFSETVVIKNIRACRLNISVVFASDKTPLGGSLKWHMLLEAVECVNQSFPARAKEGQVSQKAPR